MSRVSAESIKLELSNGEASLVGWAIKENLLNNIENHYHHFDRETFDEQEGSLVNICGDLLTIAYGYNYYRVLEQEISKKFKESTNDQL